MGLKQLESKRNFGSGFDYSSYDHFSGRRIFPNDIFPKCQVYTTIAIVIKELFLIKNKNFCLNPNLAYEQSFYKKIE